MNITKMNLQHCFENEAMLQDLLEEGSLNGRYLQIEPIVNRDGIFKRGKDCWFEVRGRAFTYDITMFKYEFSLLDYPSLSAQQLNALQAIVKTKLASNQQKKLYDVICYHAKDFSRRLDVYKGYKECGMFK
jgi:hypothetical protein